MGAWARTHARPARQGTTALHIGIVMMVLGALVGGAVFVRILVAAAGTVNGPQFDTPGTSTVTIDEGTFVVFEHNGTQSGGGGITYKQTGPTTIRPSEVHVTGPNGVKIAVRSIGSVQTVTSGTDIFRGVAEFDAPSAGDYRVDISATATSRVLVGPSISAAFARMVPWFLGLVACGVVFVVGASLLIVGLVRRSRGRQPPVAPFDPYGPGTFTPYGAPFAPGPYAPGPLAQPLRPPAPYPQAPYPQAPYPHAQNPHTASPPAPAWTRDLDGTSAPPGAAPPRGAARDGPPTRG